MRALRSTIFAFKGGGVFLALAALLAIGVAGSARASTLDFTGTLTLRMATLPKVAIPGAGSAQVTDDGSFHLLSFFLPAGAFGPVNASLPLTSGSLQSVRFTSIENLSGSFTGISGGSPGGGTMGLSGSARICLTFATACRSAVVIPFTPTANTGMGIDGTQLHSAPVSLTMQHAPWTIGQPVMTIHTPNSTPSTPVLPGGFAHGPASLTSSTAQRGGALQMVSATKVFTSLITAFPELPVYGVLDLVFPDPACDDGEDNDGDGFTDFPDDPGCDDADDRSEQSSALVCDNGLDDDEDGLIDVAEDPGCDHPTDPSEQSPLIACDDGDDNDGDGLVDGADPGCTEPADGAETEPGLVCDDGTDNDDDGLVDTSDPGCDEPLDPFEQNCGKPIALTSNVTADGGPAVSEADSSWHPGSKIAWSQQEGGADWEILLWDGSSVTPLTDNALHDMFPAIAGPNVVWHEWGAGDSRILLWTGSTPVPLSEEGMDGWAPDTDGSGVVWNQAPSMFFGDKWIYHWDGSETAQVFGSLGGTEPAISENSIVWETNLGIHMWTGSTTVVISGSAGGHAPSVWKTQVVWHASDGSDDEIYYWDGLETQQLTSNESDDRNADISEGRVVWESADGIQVWRGGTTSLIAGSLGGQLPKIDGIDVVWQASDGSDNEIFLVTLCVQCNDGADNDADGKIDYDGGLSALGYVAAETDPQCAGKPWRDRERKKSLTCGLGAELLFLLLPLLWLYRRRGRRGAPVLLALAALLAVGMAGSARASTLEFTGTLTLRMATLPKVAVPGGGSAQLTDDGSFHLLSFFLPAGAFGPANASLPLTSSGSLQSVHFTSIENLIGSFTGISGGSPGGGTMGLSGSARICLPFASACRSAVVVPLAPTGNTGMGIDGTQLVSGAVELTMQHAPWTIGQPVMTIHSPNSTITAPVLPGGFAHGPASLTSSTAQRGGALQMVTATKVFTSLVTAFPELPVYSVLDLVFPARACSDGEDDDGDGFTDFPDDPGCDDADDRSEQSAALVCDNGLDDDEDGLIDVAEDPGCDHPTDPSEQSPLIACDDGDDNDGDGLVDGADPGCTEPADGAETEPGLVCDDGTDNDADGLVDTSDPGCDEPLDPFEQNCGKPIALTSNVTADAGPAVSEADSTWHPGAKIAWSQQEGGADWEILLWDGSSVTPLTDNALHDMFPAIAGPNVVWHEWGAGDSRILLWTGSTPVALSEEGMDGWSPDTDGSGVVWNQAPSMFFGDKWIYHWDGSETAQVFGSLGGTEPAISENSIVWETNLGIHMWTGSTTVVISGSAGGHAPSVWKTQVVWHASDGSDDEIYYWDGLETQQLTSNESDDRNADISEGRVAWESAEGIQVWRGGVTSLIAGSLGGQLPKIDGIDVVWQASDGSDNEIFAVTLCVQCNDGADNDADGKIDYDGGLSALGYVAAETDPQCSGKPWRDRERKKRLTCGLGAELLFLLLPLLWLYRRRGRRGAPVLLALAALLAVGMAGSARAATLEFTGTLTLHISTLPKLAISGGGSAQLTDDGSFHLLSFFAPAGAFGPVNVSLPITSSGSIQSVRFSTIGNLSGSFTGISGGPPGGGTMGVSGRAKLCIGFASNCGSAVPFPLAPTTGGAGFGIGGTAIHTGPVEVTMQHAPWTIGQPVMSIHTPNSTHTTPVVLPGGFAHGPASLTSSTAQRGGALQMVTATKVFTSLITAFPELPVYSVLDLVFPHPACSDGEDNDGDGFTDFANDPGCDDTEDRSEQSSALVCDNGLDDDEDGVIDVAEDPGCDHPTDPSEQTPSLVCDNGLDDDEDGVIDVAEDPGCDHPTDPTETDPDLLCDDGADNDDDGLVDTSDPGCDVPADPFEENCEELIQLTDNATDDQFPEVSGEDLPGHPGSQVAWQHWVGSYFDILLWDGSTFTTWGLDDMFPTLAGDILAFEDGDGDFIWVRNLVRPVKWDAVGVSGQDDWSPDTDGSRVVWSSGSSRLEPPEGVYHWARGEWWSTRVPGSDGGMEPAISGDTIVWETSAGIHAWNGSTTALIPGSAGGHRPAISGTAVVWHASDGNDDEVFFWDGLETQQLTDNAIEDRNADISGNRIVWESDEGIKVWRGGAITPIAGSLGGHSPKIDGLDVVWHASDGSDDEIYLATLCVQCNDGADNDGDGKIDYDGGLSALGYVAAETDPQCAGKPWRDRERKKRLTCGLGAELLFLLLPLLWLYRRRGRRGGPALVALAALLAVGMAGSARASTLDFTGTLSIKISTAPGYPALAIPGGGSVQVTDDGSFHLLSFLVPDGAFGPVNASLPVTSYASTNSLRFTGVENLSGSFTGISGAPPGGGTMGVSGRAKICLLFATNCGSAIRIPLGPTTGGAGFGIGGTAIHTGPVEITMQHAPWTIGQPVMSIHTPNSTHTTPVLPGGFAHGPASLTSSTAQRGGALQMVTATKVFTSLTSAFPELPVYSVLDLVFPHPACSDGEDNDGDGFSDFANDPGCDDAEDRSEQSSALVCDNGLDDDGDGVIDVAEDPGCDHPTDPSEQTPSLVCDNGLDDDEDGLVDVAEDPGCAEPADATETDPDLFCDDGADNDGDGLVDTSDPGCDAPADPFEQNCGELIQLTDNATDDQFPVVSGADLPGHPGSQVAWHQWDGSNFEILLWNGSTVTPMTDYDTLDAMFPTMAGETLAFENGRGDYWRILVWSFPGWSVLTGQSGYWDVWSPDTDGSRVVYSRGPYRSEPAEGVYHWGQSGPGTTRVPGSDGGMEPAISGNVIVWETSAGIHMWNGSTTALMPGSAGGHQPAISATAVVWHASDGNDDEIHYWDGLETQQLTSNESDDRNADISGNRIVWESDEGIKVWRGGATTLIAGSLGGHSPKIDGLDVVWHASDGSDDEIYLATLCVQCNDGADNDGDGKIDYDGGLSALGYVAAETDPQCAGKPWRDRERKKRLTCGLGAELLFLLPPLLWLNQKRRRLR